MDLKRFKRCVGQGFPARDEESTQSKSFEEKKEGKKRKTGKGSRREGRNLDGERGRERADAWLDISMQTILVRQGDATVDDKDHENLSRGGSNRSCSLPGHRLLDRRQSHPRIQGNIPAFFRSKLVIRLSQFGLGRHRNASQTDRALLVQWYLSTLCGRNQRIV